MANRHVFVQQVFTPDGVFILKVIADTKTGGVTFAMRSGELIDDIRLGNFNNFITKAQNWFANVDVEEPGRYTFEATQEDGTSWFTVISDRGAKGVAVTVNGLWLNMQQNSLLYNQLWIGQFFQIAENAIDQPNTQAQIMVPYAEHEGQVC